MTAIPSQAASNAAGKIVLNPEQEEAADHLHGPCFVLACPGSGKTRVIVERTIRLVQKGHNPRTILCITFTNKAATEMKERISKRMGGEADAIYISTFHALCATIIRKFGAYIGYKANTTILDDDDQEGLMSQCARQAGHEMPAPLIKSLIWKANDLREKLIPECDFASHFTDEAESNIVLEYIARMRKNSQIDFSGLLSETVRLLEKDPEVLSKLQSRFDFIQVDEAQDTNYAQFKIVQLIGAHNNVLIVGDPDQGIYSWRGARYKNIEDFVNINKAKVVSLPHNYRSTPEIVKVASTLIQKNPNRQQKMEFRTNNPSGRPVECYCLPTPEHEGLWIAQRIRKMVEDEGYKPHEFAVLYRLNSMSRTIEQGMLNAGMSYQVIGGFSFFDRAEIRDALAMLRFLINTNDGMALSRFINKPSRRIGETSLGKIENFANDQGINLIEAMKRVEEYITSGADRVRVVSGCKEIVEAFNFDYTKLTIGEALGALLQKLRYKEFLESKFEKKELDDRKDNIQELINACALYGEKRGQDIAAYLNNIALQTSSDKKAEENSVSLMSIHASKGLEFPVVFMPCMEEGMMPHKRAVAERDGLEEERRLCYVGMTRAEKNLIISFPAQRMQRYKNGHVSFQNTVPSRFLTEADLMNKVRVIKGDSPRGL
jgi:DNA helicase-2/ATP-dependent DNA helicase PcrA